jgi:hypothetical protein
MKNLKLLALILLLTTGCVNDSLLRDKIIDEQRDVIRIAYMEMVIQSRKIDLQDVIIENNLDTIVSWTSATVACERKLEKAREDNLKLRRAN